MKMKKLIALLLCLTMALTACGGAGSSTASTPGTSAPVGSAPAAPAGEVEEIVFATWTINAPPTEEGLQAVEDAINEITVDKIGVKVDYQVYPIAEHNNKVSLELQSGGTIDAFALYANLPTALSTGMCYDITDLVEANCPDVLELIPEDWWDCVSQNGRIYALPPFLPSALYLNLSWRSDIAEEIGVSLEDINSVEDLTEVFAKVKASYPEMYPLIGGNAGFGGWTGMTYAIPGVDSMGDNLLMPAGVLMGDSDTVVNLFETEEYAERMALVRDWYEKGYIMQDLATYTGTNIDLFASGNGFANITGQGSSPAYVATNAANQTGQPIESKAIGAPSINTGNVTNQVFCLSANTKHAEAALKFLNLTYCDADIANLLQWGIEGRDYVVNEDGTVQPPEGFDSASVPYPGGYMNYGNMYSGLEYPAVGTPQDSIQFGVGNNYDATRSKSFGFVFDPSNVTAQYAAVNNVIMQYYSGLDCGSVDPETTIPEFNKALKDAGIDDIIAEKQAQYDAWKAAQ